jgi:hypothetical protein
MIAKLRTFLAGLSVTAMVALGAGLIFAGGEIRQGFRAACGQRSAGWLTRIARPALTRAEVLAEMKRVGLELAPRAATPGRSTGEPGSAPSPAPGAPDALQEAVQEFPIFFGKERFGPGPAGDLVDVSAWQLEPGGKVQLEGEWHDYTPPVAATCPPIAGGFFRNEGRWEKEIGAGLLGTEDGIGPGGSVSVVFRGPSTGHANWGARGLVAGGKIGEKTTGFILATGKVSF